MEERLLVVIAALKFFIDDLEESIPRTNPNHANILAWKQHNLEEAKKALKYYKNLFIHGDFRKLKDAQEIEGSCSECCRLDRADRYEEEDETLADAFPTLHEEVAKT